MPENFQTVPVSQIHPNELNHRSMDAEEIADLADSINRIGMVSPLVVYRKTNNFYTLLSGHRRLEAIQQLGWNDVTCKIVDPPADTYAEQEFLAQANMHRSSPDDLKNEITSMLRSWETMDETRRDDITHRIEEKWKEENKDNPRYQHDPAGFKRRNFRPKLTYISVMTGLNLANTTVKKYLKEIADDTASVEPDDVATSESNTSDNGPKPVTFKTLEKAAKNLFNKIGQMTPANHEIESAFADMTSQLSEFIDFVGQFTDNQENNE